jgi:hypothetical protein
VALLEHGGRACYFQTPAAGERTRACKGHEGMMCEKNTIFSQSTDRCYLFDAFPPKILRIGEHAVSAKLLELVVFV